MMAVAGVGIIGAGLYAATGGRNDPVKESPNKARDKRDLGLSGAGIAGTATAGGNERGADPSKDQKRKTNTTAPPEKLPSGGIGGGEGGGGAGAQAVQLPSRWSGSGDYDKVCTELLSCLS